MARPEADGLVEVVLLRWRIDALPGSDVAQLKKQDGGGCSNMTTPICVLIFNFLKPVKATGSKAKPCKLIFIQIIVPETKQKSCFGTLHV